MKKSILIFSAISLLVIGCKKTNPSPAPNPAPQGNVSTVTDIDGNVYKTVKIGNQIWMAENLKVTRYRNGDFIPNVFDGTQWSNLTTGAFCYIGTEKLYNYYSVVDSRNLAPVGWHVARLSELQTLVSYLGGSVDPVNHNYNIAGGKMKECGLLHWATPNHGADSLSVCGFNAIPVPCRNEFGGFSSNDGKRAIWWLFDESFYIRNDADALWLDAFSGYKQGGSVRCIKD